VLVACIPEWKNQILLCRRAIEPRQGLWAPPGGFLESGETVTQAAIREVQEEAGAATEITALYAVVSLPAINQLYLIFRGRLIDLTLRAGSESLEVRLFTRRTIPWDKLTYKMTADLLRRYFKERGLPHQSTVWSSVELL
jgi:ADP-ribose pyrophosphatase YjhB (NUDIX family)